MWCKIENVGRAIRYATLCDELGSAIAAADCLTGVV